MKYRPIAPYILLRQFVRSVSINGVPGAISGSCNHVFQSLRKYGLWGAFKVFFRKAPAPPPDSTTQKPHPFDLLHGTDTSGHMSGAYFSAVSLSSIYTTGYVGATPSALTQALSALPLQHQDFTFVDVGCGKGRALLIADQFPFRHLLGIEISPELCEIARANVAVKAGLASRISITNEDAARVIYPEGPLLLFLFNPFLAPVLRRVLRNLERQLRHSPRPTCLLYEMNPRYINVLDSFPFLKELSETIYSFSQEDAAFDPMSRTEESFTLYSADLSG
jgi:SAM-dependent methyltransferase